MGFFRRQIAFISVMFLLPLTQLVSAAGLGSAGPIPCKEKDGLFYCHERADPLTLPAIEKYLSTEPQGKNVRTILNAPNVPVDEKLKGLIESNHFSFFEAAHAFTNLMSINSYKNNLIFVAYVSIKDPNLPDFSPPRDIEMYMGVGTTTGIAAQTHTGIVRNVSYNLNGGEMHPHISLNLHGYAAGIFGQEKLYMVNVPQKVMKDIIIHALPKGENITYWIGFEQLDHPPKPEDHFKTTKPLKRYVVTGYLTDKFRKVRIPQEDETYQLISHDGSLFTTNKRESEPNVTWYDFVLYNSGPYLPPLTVRIDALQALFKRKVY